MTNAITKHVKGCPRCGGMLLLAMLDKNFGNPKIGIVCMRHKQHSKQVAAICTRYPRPMPETAREEFSVSYRGRSINVDDLVKAWRDSEQKDYSRLFQHSQGLETAEASYGASYEGDD